MRFISKYGRFGVQVRPLVQEAYATGLIKVVQDPVYAMFEPNKLTPIEREMAVTHWMFNGFYQEQDEVTIVPPDYRIGLFDSAEARVTHGWTEETEREVVETLLDLSERFNDILPVRSMIAPPWPRYDEFRGTPLALVRRLVDDGHDLDAVLTYEKEHQNRPKIVEEIGKAIESGVIALEVEEEVLG